MARAAPKLGLGATLRALRLKRSLTLKQVAAASHEVGTDMAGRISNPYLSQLECGRVALVSLPKLITLATVYGVDVGELIEKAPPSKREKLARDIDDWLRSGRQIPDPLDNYMPPEDRKPIEARLDDLLTPLAAGGMPWRSQLTARVQARLFVLYAAALPYLETTGADAIRLFWSARLEYVRRRVEAGSGAAYGFWTDIVERLESWLIYEGRRAEAAFGLVASWSIDFATRLTACHFKRPEHESAYAFDGVPLYLAWGVHRQSLARLLAASAPRTLRALPPPPPLIGGLQLYLRELIDPESRSSEPLKTPAVGSVIGTIAALARAMPGLATAPRDPREIEAVVRFLRHSGVSPDA